MTHRDRAGDAAGHRAGRREAAGPAGHPPSAAAARPSQPKRLLRRSGPPLLRRTGRRAKEGCLCGELIFFESTGHLGLRFGTVGHQNTGTSR